MCATVKLQKFGVTTLIWPKLYSNSRELCSGRVGAVCPDGGVSGIGNCTWLAVPPLHTQKNVFSLTGSPISKTPITVPLMLIRLYPTKIGVKLQQCRELGLVQIINYVYGMA